MSTLSGNEQAASGAGAASSSLAPPQSHLTHSNSNAALPSTSPSLSASPSQSNAAAAVAAKGVQSYKQLTTELDATRTKLKQVIALAEKAKKASETALADKEAQMTASFQLEMDRREREWAEQRRALDTAHAKDRADALEHQRRDIEAVQAKRLTDALNKHSQGYESKMSELRTDLLRAGKERDEQREALAAAADWQKGAVLQQAAWHDARSEMAEKIAAGEQAKVQLARYKTLLKYLTVHKFVKDVRLKHRLYPLHTAVTNLISSVLEHPELRRRILEQQPEVIRWAEANRRAQQADIAAARAGEGRRGGGKGDRRLVDLDAAAVEEEQELRKPSKSEGASPVSSAASLHAADSAAAILTSSPALGPAAAPMAAAPLPLAPRSLDEATNVDFLVSSLSEVEHVLSSCVATVLRYNVHFRAASAGFFERNSALTAHAMAVEKDARESRARAARTQQQLAATLALLGRLEVKFSQLSRKLSKEDRTAAQRYLQKHGVTAFQLAHSSASSDAPALEVALPSTTTATVSGATLALPPGSAASSASSALPGTSPALATSPSWRALSARDARREARKKMFEDADPTASTKGSRPPTAQGGGRQHGHSISLSSSSTGAPPPGEDEDLSLLSPRALNRRLHPGAAHARLNSQGQGSVHGHGHSFSLSGGEDGPSSPGPAAKSRQTSESPRRPATSAVSSLVSPAAASAAAAAQARRPGTSPSPSLSPAPVPGAIARTGSRSRSNSPRKPSLPPSASRADPPSVTSASSALSNTNNLATSAPTAGLSGTGSSSTGRSDSRKPHRSSRGRGGGDGTRTGGGKGRGKVDAYASSSSDEEFTLHPVSYTPPPSGAPIRALEYTAGDTSIDVDGAPVDIRGEAVPTIAQLLGVGRGDPLVQEEAERLRREERRVRKKYEERVRAEQEKRRAREEERAARVAGGPAPGTVQPPLGEEEKTSALGATTSSFSSSSIPTRDSSPGQRKSWVPSGRSGASVVGAPATPAIAGTARPRTMTSRGRRPAPAAAGMQEDEESEPFPSAALSSTRLAQSSPYQLPVPFGAGSRPGGHGVTGGGGLAAVPIAELPSGIVSRRDPLAASAAAAQTAMSAPAVRKQQQYARTQALAQPRRKRRGANDPQDGEDEKESSFPPIALAFGSSSAVSTTRPGTAPQYVGVYVLNHGVAPLLSSENGGAGSSQTHVPHPPRAVRRPVKPPSAAAAAAAAAGRGKRVQVPPSAAIPVSPRTHPSPPATLDGKYGAAFDSLVPPQQRPLATFASAEEHVDYLLRESELESESQPTAGAAPATHAVHA